MPIKNGVPYYVSWHNGGNDKNNQWVNTSNQTLTNPCLGVIAVASTSGTTFDVECRIAFEVLGPKAQAGMEVSEQFDLTRLGIKCWNSRVQLMKGGKNLSPGVVGLMRHGAVRKHRKRKGFFRRMGRGIKNVARNKWTRRAFGLAALGGAAYLGYRNRAALKGYAGRFMPSRGRRTPYMSPVAMRVSPDSPWEWSGMQSSFRPYSSLSDEIML
jgi:hypothetical protein